MKKLSGLSALILGLVLSTSTGSGQTVGNSTTAQTLSSGTLTETGTLNVGSGGNSPSGNGTPAVTVTGSSSIINNGTIEELDKSSASAQNGRAIYLNTTHVTLTITNNAGALIETGDADDIQANKPSDIVTLNNYGTIKSDNASSNGAQAVDFNAVTASGGNTVNNYSTGTLTATEADAVRPGVNGIVNNSGSISSSTTTGSSSDGIDAQTNSGITITNAAAVTGTGGANLIEGARDGITGGNTSPAVNSGTYTMSITNNAGGTIQGDNGSGINIDGINGNEVVTIVNNGNIYGDGHSFSGNTTSRDGDGVDVDGLVNLTNTGTITSKDAYQDTSEGVTVGGGTIVNSGTIEGSVTTAGAASGAVGRGITLAGVDKDVNNNDAPFSPPQAIYAATSVTNSGLIKGDSDSGIAIEGIARAGFNTYNVTITNTSTGTIKGGGTSVAAIEAGTTAAITTASANNLTINDSGIIDGSSSGKAIDFGSGANALVITGGSAQVLGNITGGAGTNTISIDPGTGNSFSYAGSMSNITGLEDKSGTVTFTGASTYSGPTKISGGTTYVNNTSGSGTGSSSIEVVKGAFFGGKGIVQPGAGNAVKLDNGGTLISGVIPATGTVASGGLTLDASAAKGVVLDASAGNATLTFMLGSGPSGSFSFGNPDTNSSFLSVIGNFTGELKFISGDNINLDDLTGGRLQLLMSSPYLLISTTAGDNSDFMGLTTTGGSTNGIANNGYVTNLNLEGLDSSVYSNARLFLDNGNLEVVPEPSTWALMLGGLLTLIVIRFRRRLKR
jgi:hypothetical protein